MRRLSALTLPLLVLALAGCTVDPPIVSGPAAGPLRASLGVEVGAQVVLTLRVTNVSAAPETVRFSSGQQVEFKVAEPSGRIVWSWMADKLFTAALTSRVVAPGETVAYTGEWTPSARGSFVARGELTSSSHAAEASAAFTLP